MLVISNIILILINELDVGITNLLEYIIRHIMLMDGFSRNADSADTVQS